ncbi:MAG: ExeM/NucH family extracellular endonuclease [Roseovarius sp.]|nr:ExeM/NucH family extracellular endonuclease [Roseovarius sp.]
MAIFDAVGGIDMTAWWRSFVFGTQTSNVLTGTDKKDILFGFGGDDILSGGGGNDLLFAGSGNDSLTGGAGRDNLYGDRGDDMLAGGEGDDFLSGGRGFDTAIYEGGFDDYAISVRGGWFGRTATVSSVTATVADAGRDRLTGVEALYFAADDLTIFIDGRNNAVIAGDDTATAREDGSTEIAVADLVANDRDFDGDRVAITAVSTISAAGALVRLEGDQVIYEPGTVFDHLDDGETATDSFTYTVGDGRGGLSAATVTVTITGANDAPVLSALATVTIDENTLAIPADILASDVEDDALSFAITGGADAALFAIDAETGALSFIAAPDFETPADVGGDNVYDVQIGVSDGDVTTTADIVVTIADVQEIAPRINEFHYDNAGADVGEFIEVRVAAGSDVSATTLALYNGNGGGLYATLTLPATPASSDGVFDYYVVNAPGLQNGSPDGLALVNGGAVVEFLSYEGAMTAADGPAAGLTSTDVGGTEPGTTPVGFSLQRNEDGTWRSPEAETRGAANDGVAPPPDVAINEFRVSSGGASDNTSNFVELVATPGQSFDGLTLLAVSGEFSPGQVDFAISLNGAVADENGFLLIAEQSNPALESGDVGVAGLDFFGSPQSFLVVDGFTGNVGDDLDPDNDGALDADVGAILASLSLVDGDATPDVNYSRDVFGPDGTFTPAGGARNPDGSGAFTQLAFGDTSADTPGATNAVGPATPVLISEVQGAGAVAARLGEVVTVNAVVTYLVADGFFLQEEDTDADGNAATSEGIFVFMGAGTTLPNLGDQVSVTGTVTEFFEETQIGNVTNVTVQSSGNPMPTLAEILLSQSASDFEAVEGMRFRLSSGIAGEEITVIENFNLDRFGEITVSAGTQTQATQLFDAQTEAAQVAQVIEGNLNNRLIIDDGQSGQNPDAFAFVPNLTPGDNGNGILDAGDTFAAEGATLRLGAEITGVTGDAGQDAITGVMRFSFGEYRMLIDGQLVIDPTTNEGARPATPEDVGGDIQVAAFNVLNYFTSLSDATATNPAGQARGAASASDLERQTTKLVEAFLETGAEVFAIQEIENNGFDAGSAIAAFVDALNAEALLRGSSAVYAFVDPTLDGGPIGTDAITTGLIYDASAVSLVSSDVHVFTEGSAADTLALAEVLNPFVSSGDQLGDFQRNRPVVAAEFEDKVSGVTFTVASNHFKSKGDSGLVALADAAQAVLSGGGTGFTQADIDALRADPNFDQGDGQGFWNAVRADAAGELIAWLETGYNDTGTDHVLMLGDFNAYAKEDPVQTISETAGYVDLIDNFIGQEDAFSFIFDGQQGTLDQALASVDIASLVTGVTEWHINAQEPDLLSYNSLFNNPGFFSEDVFASSDHDPLILGLDTQPDLFVG